MSDSEMRLVDVDRSPVATGEANIPPFQPPLRERGRGTASAVVGAKTEKMHQDNGCSGRGRGSTPGSGADEQRGCTPPLCVRTQSPKHGIDTPCEENSNTTPAPRLGIGGPCHRADERGAGGRDRHHTSPCKTQWPKHPTASLNAQGTDADCAVQHPAADTRCVNAPSARTFPNTKTRFRPLNICSFSPPPAGVRHNGEPPASAGAAESKKTPTQASFFVEQFLRKH